MAKYTIAECPEFSVTVRGKDSPATRQRAMDKIIELMDTDELPTELPDGLSSEQLIEVKEGDIDAENADAAEEDAVIRAVRELNNLANLKIKVQELHQSAIKARKDLDILFIDTPIEQEPDQFKELLKGSFKVLKDFATASANYKEAKIKAENARTVIDTALQLQDTEPSTPAK
ncbi:MAG: hypothetical protein JOZ78_21545 [Chroococcidiopsidaceae cyanobacterium CP_BM_ER_R8_30]|nr:hypothetical protein [Chroococcidiopsidaceae cyanobacterium CP_BM_ER_R8_30]